MLIYFEMQKVIPWIYPPGMTVVWSRSTPLFRTILVLVLCPRKDYNSQSMDSKINKNKFKHESKHRSIKRLWFLFTVGEGLQNAKIAEQLFLHNTKSNLLRNAWGLNIFCSVILKTLPQLFCNFSYKKNWCSLSIHVFNFGIHFI